MHNAVISVKKRINDPRFIPLGQSGVDNSYLYEVEYSVISLRNNLPPECAKFKLLNSQESLIAVPHLEYVNSENIWDPYNYKDHYGKNK